MPAETGRKPQTTAGAETQSLEEQIRRRAYELYEEHGRQDGHELDHWLQAEEEITQNKTRTIAA